MGVNHDEEGVPSNRTSEINMDPLSKLRRPNPGVQRSHGRRVPHLLTLGTALCLKLKVLVQLGPPDVASGQGIHTANAGVTSMKLL